MSDEKQHTIRGKVVEVGAAPKGYEMFLRSESLGLLRFECSRDTTREAAMLLYQDTEVTYVLDDLDHRRALSVRRVEN